MRSSNGLLFAVQGRAAAREAAIDIKAILPVRQTAAAPTGLQKTHLACQVQAPLSKSRAHCAQRGNYKIATILI
jgi:hypothetical protein